VVSHCRFIAGLRQFRRVSYGPSLATGHLHRQNAEMTVLAWAWLSTPVGDVSVGCSTHGVAQVRYGLPPAAAGPADDPAARQLAELARQQLTGYFRGQRTEFDLPVDWSATAGPQREVLTVLAASVGYGQTITYGALASQAGLAGSDGMPPARAVGTIMGSNPVPVIVPCHRVLASDGLGGYSGGAGVEVKRWLLILEGSLPPTLDWQPMDP
jgi:methylated-DNA-[protein]-cysteine S-methyltransferase